MEMLLGGAAVKPATTEPVATKVKLALSRVTDNEALFVWEIDGAGWGSTSTAGYVTTFKNPTGEGVKGEIEVSFQAVHFKNGGMDVTMTRRMKQGEANRTEGGSSVKFIGLPSMPLSKLLKVRAKEFKAVSGTGRVELADVNIPASQFTTFEWRKLSARSVQNAPVVYSKRIRLKNGQPAPGMLMEPDAARMMKREDLWSTGNITPAVKETLTLDFS
jgi:hypothetical protein